MAESTKKMSVKEFRKLGYLQELNRQFLHPLGMALDVVIEKNGRERFGEVRDDRDNPEGFIFGPGMIDGETCGRILNEQYEKGKIRNRRLGYNIQN